MHAGLKECKEESYLINVVNILNDPKRLNTH